MHTARSLPPRDLVVLPVNLDREDPRVMQDNKDNKGQKVTVVVQVLQDLRDLRDLLESEDHKD
tara:strand:+ start:290 stop:478 length:189 start_codon:yes stop_codon:yes gene_type:complete